MKSVLKSMHDLELSVNEIRKNYDKVLESLKQYMVSGYYDLVGTNVETLKNIEWLVQHYKKEAESLGIEYKALNELCDYMKSNRIRITFYQSASKMTHNKQ